MLRRKTYDRLVAWKKRSHGTSALLVEGARRVGKSTTVEEFARDEYDSYILIDFSLVSNELKQSFLDLRLDLSAFFLYLSASYGVTLYPRRSLIIFDEPFANLDWPGVKQVCGIMKQLKEEGKTVLVLTHELEKVLALADRFLVLDKGHLVFDGTPESGLAADLESWGIRNPMTSYKSIKEMIWL